MKRQHKSNKKGRILRRLTIFLILVLAGAAFLYHNGNVSGKWHSPHLEKLAQQKIQEEWNQQVSGLGTELDLTSLLKEQQVVLEVKEDKAVLSLTASIDKSALLSSLGISSDSFLTETLTATLEEAIVATLDNQGIAYDTKTGTLSTMLFEGKINPLLHIITIEKINTASWAGLASSGLKEGSIIPYWKMGSTISFAGNSDYLFDKLP
ncbi:hypothetical protein AB1I63_05265 [Streptococcus pneumoniae]